jgi:arabinose-5-phosphate isomerase
MLAGLGVLQWRPLSDSTLSHQVTHSRCRLKLVVIESRPHESWTVKDECDMDFPAIDSKPGLTRFQLLERAVAILRDEAAAIAKLADRLTIQFCDAIDLVLSSQGSVIVTGMGKAGLIGQKLTATLASTGTPSHFLHPAEATHGDLGRIQQRDVVIALSQSGETDEILRLMTFLTDNQISTIAITGRRDSSLGRAATVVLDIGSIREAGDLKLAPTNSTTVMLALGDALALVLSELRGFRPQDFARLHPAGSLGRALARVDDVMRALSSCRVAHDRQTVRQVLVSLSRPGRRAGAVLLTSSDGRLSGIFTDSDLARLLEQGKDESLDRPVGEVMTRSPMTVEQGTMMRDAIPILQRFKISELPVIDSHGYPLGMIDITDVVGFIPPTDSSQPIAPAGDRVDLVAAPEQTIRAKSA